MSGGLKAGHKGKQDKFKLNGQHCGACSEPVEIIFVKPARFVPSLSHVECQKCKSTFLYKIEQKMLVDENGNPMPVTVTRKVKQLTPEGLRIFQNDKINKNAELSSEALKAKRFADRMGGD